MMELNLKDFFDQKMKTVSLRFTEDQYKTLHAAAVKHNIMVGQLITIFIHCFLVDITPEFPQHRDSFWELLVENHMDMVKVGVELPPDYPEVIKRLGEPLEIEFEDMGACIIALQSAKMDQVINQIQSMRN